MTSYFFTHATTRILTDAFFLNLCSSLLQNFLNSYQSTAYSVSRKPFLSRIVFQFSPKFLHVPLSDLLKASYPAVSQQSKTGKGINNKFL
jgi:hypothetical protein